MADQNGLVLSHVVEESIGTTTTSEVLQPVFEQIRNGSYESTEAHTGHFDYEGQKVSSSYIYIPEAKWVLGVDALDSQLYENVGEIIFESLIIGLIAMVIISISIMFFSMYFTKPLEYMNG